MRLEREASDPLYLQLRDTLEAQIRAGVYQRHQRLPSERELSERFNISRMTARQALMELARAGVVYTRVGKGTFVAEPKIDQQLQSLTGFSEDVRARNGKPSSRVLEARVFPATPDVAAALRIAPGTDVIQLARVRMADGSPLSLEVAHLPTSMVPGLLTHDFSHESLYDVLENSFGLRLTQAEQRIEAGLANSRELELLELIPPAPVLRMQRLTLAAAGVPVEWVLSAFRGDRYAFRSTLVARGHHM